MSGVFNELRLAFRQLSRRPAFVAVIVLTLALGIGANTLVFSLARTVLGHPHGYPDADHVGWIERRGVHSGTREELLSWRDHEDLRERVEAFAAVALLGRPGGQWEHDGTREDVALAISSAGLVEVLGMRPELGRLLRAEDTLPGAEPVIVLAHEFWQARMAGAADVLGRSLRLDGRDHRIVGVLPAAFRFPEANPFTLPVAAAPQLWRPILVQGEDRESREARMFQALARRRAEMSEARVLGRLQVVGQRLAAEFPASNRLWDFGWVRLRDRELGGWKWGLPLLTVAVAGVLLVCCLNVANLLLARCVVREREFAVRRALGASSSRLVVGLLMEGLALAVAGGVLGVALAEAGLHLVKLRGSGVIPWVTEARLDGAVVGFVMALAVTSALLVALLPAWWQFRGQPMGVLGATGRSTSGKSVHGWQRGLLVAQVAIVLAVLSATALLGESLRRLLRQDLGFRTDAVVAMDLQTPDFPTNEAVFRAYQRLRERLLTLPGVTAVGTISSVPLTDKWTFSERADVVGQSRPEEEQPLLAATFVAFDYFQALQIPLLDGRFFREEELHGDGNGPEVILNASAARALFPDGRAVGRRITMNSSSDRALEVVGVVGDTRDMRLEERPQPRLYWHYPLGSAQVVVRSAGSLGTLMESVRRVVPQVDTRLRIEHLRPLDDVVLGTVAQRRLVWQLLAAYAGLAVVIAAVGVFAVVHFQVARRVPEFGIRLTLGATGAGLVRLVLREILLSVVAGLVLGLGIAVLTNRLVAAQLYEVSPQDPGLLLGVVVVLLFVALVAGWFPARRASAVDPVLALRSE